MTKVELFRCGLVLVLKEYSSLDNKNLNNVINTVLFWLKNSRERGLFAVQKSHSTIPLIFLIFIKCHFLLDTNM